MSSAQPFAPAAWNLRAMTRGVFVHLAAGATTSNPGRSSLSACRGRLLSCRHSVPLQRACSELKTQRTPATLKAFQKGQDQQPPAMVQARRHPTAADSEPGRRTHRMHHSHSASLQTCMVQGRPMLWTLRWGRLVCNGSVDPCCSHAYTCRFIPRAHAHSAVQ